MEADKMNQPMRKNIISVLMVCILAFTSAIGIVGMQSLWPSGSGIVKHAFAASKKAKNKKARRAYLVKMKALSKKAYDDGYSSPDLYYRYYDLDRDGVVEALCWSKKTNGYKSWGSGWSFRVLDFRGGKVKRVKNTNAMSYPSAGFKVYRKSKSFVDYMCSHANEIYSYYKLKNRKVKRCGCGCKCRAPLCYYKLKNRKFKRVAYKQRYSKKAGYWNTTAWTYFDGKGNEITKAAFKRKISRVVVGKAKKLGSAYKWKSM